MRATFVRKPYPDLLARLMIELPDLLLKSPDQSSEPGHCRRDTVMAPRKNIQ